MDSVRAFDTNTNVYIMDDPRDKDSDRVLVGQVGRLLSEHYPGWGWYVDCPPEQDALIIRNLTCDFRGKYGFMIRKSKINTGSLRHEVLLAAGAFLERYEHIRRHCGRFRPDDITIHDSIFGKPQE